jgi:hypothetical protein
MSGRETSEKNETTQDHQKTDNMEERLLEIKKADTSLRHPSPAVIRGTELRTAHSASSSLKESVSGRLISGVVGVAEVLLRGSRNPSNAAGNSSSADALRNTSLEDIEALVQPHSDEIPSALNNKEPKKNAAVQSVSGPDTTGSQPQHGSSSGLLRTDPAVDSVISKDSQPGRSVTPNPVNNKYPNSGSAWNMKSHSESSFLDSTPKRGDSECRSRDDNLEMNSPKMEADRKLNGPSHTHTTPQNQPTQSTAHKSQLLGGMVGSAVTISSGVVEGIRNSVPSLPSTSMFTWTGGKNSAEDLQRLGEENIALASEVKEC